MKRSIILSIILLLFIFILSFVLLVNYLKKRNSSEERYVNVPDYSILEMPNFLTSDECEHIIKISKNNLFHSQVYSADEDVISETSRVSKQCWLKDDDEIVKKISEKVRNLTNTGNKWQEELQVVKYEKGGFFSPHYDACDGDEKMCKRMNSDKGPRYFTVLFYLNDDFTGGETVFPKINKSVKPEKGKAVCFQNVDDNGVIISQAFHGGQPVESGEKWIANKWIRLT